MQPKLVKMAEGNGIEKLRVRIVSNGSRRRGRLPGRKRGERIWLSTCETRGRAGADDRERKLPLCPTLPTHGGRFPGWRRNRDRPNRSLPLSQRHLERRPAREQGRGRDGRVDWRVSRFSTTWRRSSPEHWEFLRPHSWSGGLPIFSGPITTSSIRAMRTGITLSRRRRP